MLPGLNKDDRGLLILRLRSRLNRTGLTLVEAMVVLAILCVILYALVMALSVGDLASGIGSPKADIQTDVKTITDWLVKDIRQAKIQELYNNTPTTNQIKFNIWRWDNASYAQVSTDTYIEYAYDNVTQVLSRKTINATLPADQNITYVNFTDIQMAPFYTTYTNETSKSFNSTTLLTTRTLIVAVKKAKTVRNRALNATMVEEVKIRNE